MKPHLLRKTTNIAHPTWHGRFFAGVGLILLSLASPLLAADDNSGKQSASLSQLNENGGVGGSGSTVLPDLFTGTLGYAVPIEVPPGRNGMAPKLSLSYNSHGTNGWVSYGWSLDLPYIQRQGPHKGLPTYDDTQDTFLFVAGGATIELVPRFIEWGAGYYGAKIEGPFAKFYRDSSTWGWIVTSKNGTAQKFGTTPLSRQNDLTTSLADGTKIYQWYLDTVTDLNSNTMTVTYQKDSFLAGFSSNNVAVGCSQVYPIRINYPPSSSILFDWEGRTDAHFHFRGGLCSGMRQRLKLIEVLNQTQHLRTYQLDYNDFSNTPNQSAFSRLSKITQYDHNASISGSGSTWTVTGNSLPAQTFTYTNKTQSFDASQSWTIAAATDWDGYTQSYATDTIVNSVTITISLPCSPRVQADFNGDGKIDIAYRNRAGGTNDIYVALSTGNGFQTPTQPWGAIPNWDCSKLVGDFNGDGRADVAYRDTDGIYVVYANATGSGFTSPIKLAGVPTGHWDLTRDIGDFNGDGRMDIVYGTSFSGTGSVADVYVVLSAGTGTGSTFGSPSRWNQQLNQPIPGWHTRRLSDFNGDGRTDIGSCAGDSYNCYFYVVLSDGAQFVGYRPALQFSDPVQYNHQIVIGDFNGDGLADILWPNPPNGTCQQNNCLRVYLATGMDGTGFAAMPDIYPPNYTSSTTGKGIVLGDFNGDGLTDIAYESSATADNIYVLLARESDGSPFFDAKSWGIVPTWDAVRTAVGDFNGDGMMDVATRNGSTATITVARSRPLNPDLLASIQNGLGGSTTISYAPSTQYQNSGNLPLVIQTLSSVTVNDGNGTTATSQYTYQGGWFDFTSREFRGFNQVTATDPVGTTTTTWFYQGNPALNESYALKGRPLQTQTADRNGNLYGQTVNTWSTTTPFTNTTFPELIQTNAYVYDGGAFWLKQMKVSTQYDCDLGTPCYGNVVKISNFGEISPQGQVLGPERYQHMEYIQNPSFWIMGLPSHQYTRGPGDAMNLAEAWFYYDGTPSDCSSTSKTAPLTNGNLTLTERWLKNGVNTQGITGYDTYGNPTCSKDPRGTLTAIQYDPTSTFPLVKTVSDGHTTHSHRAITAYYGVNDVATDNGFYGQVKSITDTNNQTATTQYDTFGRKTQTTAPDGGMTTTTYLDWGNPTLQRIRTVAPDGTTDGLWSETYFDGLGRTTTTVTEGPIAGKNISQNVLYNQRGLVAQKSLPYFPGETPRYTSTSYDPIGRPLQAVAPDGASTTTSYAGWQVTTLDPNGHQHRVTNNADGKVIQVDEYGTDTSTPYATTTYQYDGLGNLLKVTDAQNHLTTTSYDTFGRKIGMSDPDMGSCGDVTILQPAAAFPWYPTPCWSYEYDANGNLTRQRDARGQTTSFVYDPLNRVKTKTLADGSQVVYTYDSETSPNGIGRLALVQDTSGTTSFQYDLMGRVYKTVKTVANDPNAVSFPTGYTTQTGYDLLGRVTSITYPKAPNDPAAPSVSYFYNPAGWLDNVTENATATTYASYLADQYTALGQPKTVSYGNGVTTTYTYRPDNSQLQHMTTGTTVSTYQTLDYTLDNAGNVTFIQDPLRGDRTFAYDPSNRLIQATYGASGSTAPTSFSYGYDAIGNMTKRSQGASSRKEETPDSTLTYQNPPAPPVLIDDASPAISYENRIVNWTTTSRSQASGGSYAYSNALGDTASFVFTGTTVSWLSAKSSDSGTAAVYLDGVWQQDVNLNCASCNNLGGNNALYQQTVWSGTNLANTTHLVEIIVLQSCGQCKVAVDAFVVGTSRTEESAPAVTLTTHVDSAWTTTSTTSASGGSYAATNDSTAVVTYEFTGVGVSWLAVKSSDGYSIDVYLDGIYQQTVNLCSSGGGCGGGGGSAQYQQAVWSRADLAAGVHLLKLVVTPGQSGGGNICGACIGGFTLDALDVLPTATGSWVRTENTTVNIDYGVLRSNGWSTITDGAASGGSYHKATTSSTNGTEANYTFSGYGIAWMARKDNMAGKADVWLDGVLQATVDLYNSTTVYPLQPVWSRTDLSNGPHTLTIVVTGTKNASSGGTNVYVDALWTYNAQGWHAISEATASNGQTMTTDLKDSTATLSFTGTGVSWLAPTGPTGGTATVAIDGGTAQSLSLKSVTPRAQQIVYTTSGLTNTTHTLIIKVTSSGTSSAPAKVTLDAFDVMGAATVDVACTYTNPAHAHAVSACGSETMTYDAAGNMLQHTNPDPTKSQTYQWDAQNRLSSVLVGGSTTAFVYDGDGGRVIKTAGANPTVYIGQLYECTPGGACTRYIFAGNQRVALTTTAGQMLYYHTDHLGSTAVVTSGSGTNIGAVVQSLLYEPYGKLWKADIQIANVEHKFTGQVLDDSTGLYFYGARYYDPSLGRFISADTMVPSPFNPQALNRYSYVLNNPINLTDPSGHSWESFWKVFTMVVGIALSVAMPEFAPLLSMATSAIMAAIAGAHGAGIFAAASMGGFTGILGAAIGAGVGGTVGDFIGQRLTDLVGKTTTSFISTVIGAGTGGFVAGVGLTLATGGSWRDALQAGGLGAAVAAGTAAVVWGIQYQAAQAAKAQQATVRQASYALDADFVDNKSATVDRISISDDLTLHVRVKTSGIADGDPLLLNLEGGTVYDNRGTFSDPNFSNFETLPAKVQGGVANFSYNLGAFDQGYLRITPQYLQGPPPTLTFGINFGAPSTITPCNPCFPLYGYGGAGRS